MVVGPVAEGFLDMPESAFGVEVGLGGLSTLMRVVVVVLGDVVEVGGPGGAFAASISAVTIADPDVFIQCGGGPVGVGGLMGGQRDGAVVVGGGAVGDEGSDDGVGALGEVTDMVVGDDAVSVHEPDTDLHLGIGVGVAGAAVGLLVAVGLLAVGLFACVGLVVGWVRAAWLQTTWMTMVGSAGGMVSGSGMTAVQSSRRQWHSKGVAVSRAKAASARRCWWVRSSWSQADFARAVMAASARRMFSADMAAVRVAVPSPRLSVQTPRPARASLRRSRMRVGSWRKIMRSVMSRRRARFQVPVVPRSVVAMSVSMWGVWGLSTSRRSVRVMMRWAWSAVMMPSRRQVKVLGRRSRRAMASLRSSWARKWLMA